MKEAKNIVYVEGVKKHKRWTILNVDADVVDTVKNFATKNGYAIERALKELVKKASQNDIE